MKNYFLKYYRNWANISNQPTLGSIEIIKKNDVSIVCLHAQYAYGTINRFPNLKINSHVLVGYEQGITETEDVRTSAFEKCLENLDATIPQDSVIAFPKLIGCRSAGGKWSIYKNMIAKFAQNRNVVIIDQNVWY